MCTIDQLFEPFMQPDSGVHLRPGRDWIRHQADRTRDAQYIYAEYVDSYCDYHRSDEIVDRVIEHAICDPEEVDPVFAQLLKQMAREGDYRTARAAVPILEYLGSMALDEQELSIEILGECLYLADDDILSDGAEALAGVLVDDGVGDAALLALEHTWRRLRNVDRFRHPYLPQHRCRATSPARPDFPRPGHTTCLCNWEISCDLRSRADNEWRPCFQCHAGWEERRRATSY